MRSSCITRSRAIVRTYASKPSCGDERCCIACILCYCLCFIERRGEDSSELRSLQWCFRLVVSASQGDSFHLYNEAYIMSSIDLSVFVCYYPNLMQQIELLLIVIFGAYRCCLFGECLTLLFNPLSRKASEVPLNHYRQRMRKKWPE